MTRYIYQSGERIKQTINHIRPQ